MERPTYETMDFNTVTLEELKTLCEKVAVANVELKTKDDLITDFLEKQQLLTNKLINKTSSQIKVVKNNIDVHEFKLKTGKARFKELKQRQLDALHKKRKLEKDLKQNLKYTEMNFMRAVYDSPDCREKWSNKFDTFEKCSNYFNWTNKSLKDWRSPFKNVMLKMDFKDVEYYEAFLTWDTKMFQLSHEDRKCPICYTYYNQNSLTKCSHEFRNCNHLCCSECYSKLPEANKQCIICKK